MTAGNNARKKQRAMEKVLSAKADAEQKAQAVVPSAEQIAQPTRADTAVLPQKVNVKNENAVRRPWWIRFGRYVFDKSSFTDWCIAAFTFVLAGVAIYQYQVMGGQLAVMGNQLAVMRNDERAWVEVKELAPNEHLPPVEVVAGKPVYFPIKVINTGKTPAKQVRLTLAIEVPASENEANFECVAKAQCLSKVDVWGMLSPGDFNEIITPRFLNNAQPLAIATDTEATAWKEEKAYIAIYGAVTYVDVYNTRHWTNFCFWKNNPHYEGAEKLGFSTVGCTAYNATDTN